jgi:predicted nucleic acid-binding protein
MPGSFFDSSVLLYIASREPAKAERAENLIAVGGTISVQVLNEIANVARRKMQMSWDDTRTFLCLLRGVLSTSPITVETHERGLEIAQRYGLSVYDAMIAASALLAGCETLWSEDMHDTLLIEGRLRVSNPFRVG